MSDSAQLSAFLRGLRAVREYTPEPVDDTVLDDILEVGRWSGSASNNQWADVVVVTDPRIKQLITEGGVRAAAGAALSLVITTPGNAERHDLEVLDEGRLVERLLLAAAAHGLGSNIGTLKGDGPEQVKSALSIPSEGRAIGHTDQAAFALVRLAQPTGSRTRF